MAEYETIPFHHKSAERRTVVIISEHHDPAMAWDPSVGLKLTETDMRIEFADSVDAAMNLICSECPDVVIVDTEMLGHSPYGIELERWLSERATTHGLHVVWFRRD